MKQEKLIIFGRYPAPGKTKTRLIPALGAVGAAELQRMLTEKTLSTAGVFAEQRGCELIFCHDADPDHEVLQWLGNKISRFIRQSHGDLGRRMESALKQAFASGAGSVVLVGTDIPGLLPQTFQDAFDALAKKDLVFGPSTDGGYWLVGMNKPEPVFEAMPWSTPSLLDDTLSLAEKHGLTAALLAPLDDLDTPKDLDTINDRRFFTAPYVSVVIPALNEAGHIQAAIESATSPSTGMDAEVIVVDGGSRDRTVDIAENAGARVIQSKKGRAFQQNKGAQEAKGRVLCFLHADTILPKDYVSRIFETLMRPDVILGAFQFKTDLDTRAMKIIEAATRFRSTRLSLPYGDQGIFMRKADFQAIGGFPETPIAEDLYLVKKAVAKGRVAISDACAVTSGRRWSGIGPLNTMIINFIIAIGAVYGVPPRTLAPLYNLPKRLLDINEK